MRFEKYGIIFSDELELAVADALYAANIRFKRPARLDFFLPDYNIYVEIKRYDSMRSASQLESQENVIMIQGKKSVAFMVDILKKLTVDLQG